jgi:transcriptional regulator with XRE-family HTH domain
MCTYAVNLRRLMARGGMTLSELVEASGLHERTIKSILNGTTKPHPRTLHRLAAGLGVSTDELFQNPSLLAHRSFDRQTNPAVGDVVDSHPELFEGWTEADFAELFSRFGTGGALSAAGAAEAVLAMNEKRQVHRKVALLLESSEAVLLVGLVELLYQKIMVTNP